MSEEPGPAVVASGKPGGNRLNAKDLINIGIFSALYLVVMVACAMTGMVPVLIPLLAVLVPLIDGIPFMLYVTRIKKFGMVLIMGIIIGLIFTLGGMGTFMLPLAIVFGLIAELILRSGNYQSRSKSILAYGVFSLAVFGQFMPIFLTRDAYHEMLATGSYGLEYADTLMSVMPDWMAPVLLVCCFVFGILGGVLGSKVLKKHFERAGIA